MIIYNWNVRGLNLALKQKEVKKFILDNDVAIMGISETKVKLVNQDSIQSNIFSFWAFISNSTTESAGRIWVAWDPNKVSMQPLISNPQLIHVGITSVDLKIKFEATFIYAFNFGSQRVVLWNALRNLSRSMGSTPWLTLGDFNVTLKLEEIQGTDKSNAQDRTDFLNCLTDSYLVDLRYIGIYYS